MALSDVKVRSAKPEAKPIRKGIKHEWKLRAAFCGHGFRAMACSR